MDPAALGTALIGLETIRRQGDRGSKADPRPDRSRRPHRRTREVVAAILRRTAELIEPTPLPAG